MIFAIGFACGVVVCGIAAFATVYAGAKYEWTQRMYLERDLKRTQYDVGKLMRKLACGAGYVGCPGGPSCDSDHK